MDLHKLDVKERRDWLRLCRTPTIGPVAFQTLMNRFGNPERALAALPDLKPGKQLKIPGNQEIENELEAADDLGIDYVAACEPRFSNYLRFVDPPPPMISVWGRTELLNTPSVAIIGSRNASAIGVKFARQMAQELGQAGFTIVSGLARGIDTAAHWGALETGTIAVLGGGVDHVYPRQNADLFEEIKKNGALVSESPLGYQATARDFPRRNRIISGLCRGVVVIEAAERSGTLITARYALEQNREVMAAPGSPLDPRTKGCNRLIRQGAHLIENSEQILDILSDLPGLNLAEPETPYRQSGSEDFAAAADIEQAKSRLKQVMSPTPTPRDDLIRSAGLDTGLANAALLELELTGEISAEPDGRMGLLY